MASNASNCAHLRDPNPYTVSLATFILVGIIVSYLPQHIKIITRRSSDGLSPWWVLLGGLSGIAALANILVLPASRADMACCRKLSPGECASALLGVTQIGLQWACFMFIVLLYLIFFPSDDEVDLSSSTASLTKTPPAKRRDALIVGVSMLAALFIVGITSIAIVVSSPRSTNQAWANALGTTSSILAMIQYLPQIYFTWRNGEIGSLSIITMLIQVPGSFLFAFSLWLRVGAAGWSTWLVFIVTGSLQSFLLGLAIKYYFAAEARGENAVENEGSVDDENAEENNERTALLSNGHAANKSVPSRGRENGTSLCT